MNASTRPIEPDTDRVTEPDREQRGRHRLPEGTIRGHVADPHMGIPWFGGVR